jgi:hypothetical protein
MRYVTKASGDVNGSVDDVQFKSVSDPKQKVNGFVPLKQFFSQRHPFLSTRRFTQLLDGEAPLMVYIDIFHLGRGWDATRTLSRGTPGEQFLLHAILRLNTTADRIDTKACRHSNLT